uniref:Nicotinate-nucleotide pyrophosphorylase [carboxylating] n=1 Tax=Strigamia maritima TaxID=126957 RepID=T1J5D4_STRMM
MAEDTEDTTQIEMSNLISPINIQTLVRGWLLEDSPAFDIGGAIVGNTLTTAHLFGKSPGILAGIPFVNAVFGELDCKVEWHYREGNELAGICLLAQVTGSARNILLGERVALNVLARCSGVATFASSLKKLVEKKGWKGQVAGTRKTTPGFRLVEKYALKVANIDTHRYDLSSLVMIKDNHVMSCAGNIKMAVSKAKKLAGNYIKVEVECRNLKEAMDAAEAQCDIIMLDNFPPQEICAVAKIIKSKSSHILIEASGGITETTIQQFASPFIDIISCGKLTQGYPTVDFSLKIL